ncbi:hypothetical protein LPB140_01835 [Sphingorhabdus lutea]|uniref:DUF1800 domain-containing protein n=1 Tax=Sphingorhabdus lutea TaxID=1913578 RepID=A0A1L3JEB7_9SPHN|nr:DUF1800 domain-containing protein [Sphingorhabdus lutea]APG63472.1 hypothetical protein LPB140_01835 [Sphingorhabdus lutea]
MAKTYFFHNRFGLGGRANEAALYRNFDDKQLQNKLLQQLKEYNPAPPIYASLASTKEIAAEFSEYQMLREIAQQQRRQDGGAAKPSDDIAIDEMKVQKEVRAIRRHYIDAATARIGAALQTDTPFAERLVHFWSNHFAISSDKLQVTAFAGNYERDAIRPNIMGSFANLLKSAVRHPAMILYLDQAQSFGPNSMIMKRRNRRNPESNGGLNENLAREILELHSLGVRSVYTQNDIQQLAMAMTGWSVAIGPQAKRIARFAGNVAPDDSFFVDMLHEPGTRSFLGKTYPDIGKDQSTHMLDDVAVHPATARFIATKLARAFTTDTPPPALISALENAFMQSGGYLPSLYKILIMHEESWNAAHIKYKSPWEWAISAMRAFGTKQADNPRNIIALLDQMGQPIWKPGAPSGFPDLNDHWMGASALMARAELADIIGGLSKNAVDPRLFASLIMNDMLQKHSETAISRADSPSQGIAMALMAPEFLRR